MDILWETETDTRTKVARALASVALVRENETSSPCVKSALSDVDRDMSDQHPPTDPVLWEGLWSWIAMIGAAGTGFVAATRAKLRRATPDYDAMAEAWFAAKEAADREHRNAIVDALRDLQRSVDRMVEKQGDVIDAIHMSNTIVREANEKTRERVADLMTRVIGGVT
jgi:hypothetical protein